MLFELSHYGLIRLQGLDALKLLQGQLSCDMNAVSEKQLTLSAHCNPQGRIISLSYVFLYKHDYYLLLPKVMLEIAINALKKYAIFYKVIISECKHLALIGYQGESPDPNLTAIHLSNNPQRYIMLLADDNSINTAQELKSNWKQFDLLEGKPNIYPETSGKFMPHEINLQHHDAISFTKGCFTGQEIIARLHYRGKLKTKMYHATIDYIFSTEDSEDLKPGLPLYILDNNHLKEAGIVVDVCEKNHDQYEALVVTTSEHAKNNHLFLNRLEKKFITITSESK